MHALLFTVAGFLVLAAADWLAGKWNGKPTRVGTLSIYGTAVLVAQGLFATAWRAD